MTVSSPTPDDSDDLSLGWWGWCLTLFATQFHFHTNSHFLSLALTEMRTLFVCSALPVDLQTLLLFACIGWSV